jgi:type II restriction enzyme
MKLNLYNNIAEKYKSSSQKIRILTEYWVDNSIFCPNCGNLSIASYPNNKPVADFYCTKCKEDFELKSKKEKIGKKVVDGAYRTMIQRLKSENNPNFFLLNYDLKNFQVQNFFVIPKHFFIPKTIEKRKPLSENARRAGWVGCNILLQNIPETGKIFFVKEKQIEPKEKVLAEWQKTLFLIEEKEIITKGWLIDIMVCIDKLGLQKFSLNDIYKFEEELSTKHPDNHHIKDKIRQQLQILRDKKYLKFIGQGKYQLL